jgi:ATP-dependent DNA helicase 2 subunit 1
MKRIR